MSSVARVFPSLLLALALVGCEHREEASKVDAAPSAPPMVVLDAAPPTPPTPVATNVNRVARFPDEQALNNAAAKVADPSVAARSYVPGGALVTMLKLGTPVVQIAKHEGFVLCTFPDPKNASAELEGWIAEQAFVAGPTVPSKAACPKGQSMLMVDEQNFCGHVCKTDKECAHGQTCTGSANLFASGKSGAQVSTCTIPPGGAAAGGGAAGGGSAAGGGGAAAGGGGGAAGGGAAAGGGSAPAPAAPAASGSTGH